jgi:hypothetical protein
MSHRKTDLGIPSREKSAKVVLVVAVIFRLIAGLRPGAAWLGLIFGLGFALALLVEFAGGGRRQLVPTGGERFRHSGLS